MSSRITRPLARALLLAGLATFGAATASAAEPDPLTTRSAAASLPDLGSGANALITRQEEFQIGRMMMRDLRRENLVLEDPESTSYLQGMGSSIGVEAQDGEHQLNFFVVRDRSINAFAIPGGFIGVNVGLILRTESESELAGVMAHEIGHVVQRHIARSVLNQGRNSMATLASTLGAILIGAITGSANAAAGLVAIAQGTAMQQNINFTRMEEQEADRVGIAYMAAAGYDPHGMASFFGTMMRERGGGADQIPQLLLSHPIDSSRIAEARARLASMPPVPKRPDSPGYEILRERLRVITAGVNDDQRPYYARLLANDSGNLAIHYGAALSEIRWGNPKQARERLQEMVDLNPGVPVLQTALAQAQVAAGDTPAAIKTFERGLEITPRNVPLTVRYAETLLADGKPKKAHEVLLDLFNNVQPTPDQIRLTALAASAAGDTGDAYYYMSELHIANGDLMLATTQLDLAIAAPGLTDVQRKRFLARRDEIREVLREQRGARPSRPSEGP